MKLNDQLNMIRDNIGTEQEVSITYFVPDDKNPEEHISRIPV